MKLKKSIFALLLISVFSANIYVETAQGGTDAVIRDFREQHYPADKVEGHFFNLVEFENFEFIAVTDYYKNFLDDTTKADSNEYFELNGSKIPDIYVYITDHGVEPSEGKYHNYTAQRDMPFEPIPPVTGAMDLFPDIEGVSQPQPRYRVGESNHYLVGSNVPETGIGMFVEDEDGTDRLGAVPSYIGGSGQAVWVTCEYPEMYVVHYEFQHPAGQLYEEYNGGFVKVGNGETYGGKQPVLLGSTRSEDIEKKIIDKVSKINLKHAAFAAVIAVIIGLWLKKKMQD